MSDEKDNLPEVKVGAELTENGFSASAKSRAVTALDRLVGELFDVPRISIATFNQRLKARADVREAMIRRVGEKAIGKIEVDDSAIDLIADQMVSEEIRKQDNKERVATLALEDLREDPPKDEDAYDEEEFTDWMNVFSRYAEDASSERLQQLWAKVLAGQIRKGQAFSFGTLRLLSELDPNVAREFQDILEYRIDDKALAVPDVLKGTELFKWTSLEDAGFLSGTFGLGITKKADAYGSFIFTARQFAVLGKTTPGKDVRLQIKHLTKAGTEVASILPLNNGTKAAEAIAAQAAILKAATELHLAQIVSQSGTQILTTPIRAIKTPPNT